MGMARLWQGRFWLDTLDRAITTAAQVAATMLTVNAFGQHIEWMTVAYGTATAVMYSVLTSIARRGGTPDPPPPNGVVSPVIPPEPPAPVTPIRGPNQWRLVFGR